MKVHFNKRTHRVKQIRKAFGHLDEWKAGEHNRLPWTFGDGGIGLALGFLFCLFTAYFAFLQWNRLTTAAEDEEIISQNLIRQAMEFTLSDDKMRSERASADHPLGKVLFDEKGFLREYIYKLKDEDRLYDIFQTFQLSSQDIDRITRSAKPLFDLRRVRPGHQITMRFTDKKELEYFQYDINYESGVVVEKKGEKFESKILTVPFSEENQVYSGVISNNLYATADEIGMDYSLVGQLAEIFAYDISFNKELRKGDSFKILVRARTYKNGIRKFGKILAAQFTNQSQLYQAYHFDNGHQAGGYYNEKGQSLRKMFIRSPVPFSRISSRFNQSRFHPVLRVYKPHYGIDYAAPVGTPIRALGNGVISAAGWKGASGKMIKIRHNATYQSAYAHLQRFAKGIHVGKRVTQGQLIGYVGTTGRSTGPHCHLAFYKNGRYVDFLRQRFNAADPISRAVLGQFFQLRDSYTKTLAESPKLAVSDIR